LYGSDFDHQHVIMLELKHSEIMRDLSRDWHHTKDGIVRLLMSESQFATMISTLNVGSGTPCTLEYIGGQQIPGIATKKDRKEQFKEEMGERMETAKNYLAELRKMVENSSLSQKAKKDMLSSISGASMNIGVNLEFVKDSFGEHMEQSTEKAKQEIEAYLTASVQRLGIESAKALGGSRGVQNILPEDIDESKT